MDLLRRKLPDGRKGPGFLVYAGLFGGTALLLFLLLKGENIGSRIHGQGVDIPRVSQTVQTATPPEEPKPAPVLPSTRNISGASEIAQDGPKAPAKGGPAVPPNALDAAVAEANRPVETDRPMLPEAGGLPGSIGERGSPAAPVSSGDLDPNPLRNGLGAVAGNGTGAQTTGTVLDLVVYRRPAPSPLPPGGAGSSAGPTAPAATEKYTPGNFLPRGYYIDLYLLDTIRTDQPQPIVTFGVARDVVFGKKVFLQFGTRLLGSVGGNPDKGTRVPVNPSSFQFPDGTEWAVNGVIKGLDDATGIPAYYIPPPTWVQLSGYVNDFLSGYLDLLYLRQQQSTQLTLGSVNIGTAQPVFDYKSQALATTSEVIRDFSKKQMEELQARFAPYLTIPAGTMVRLQLTSPLALADRGVNVAQLKPVADLKPLIQGGLGAGGLTGVGASSGPILNGLEQAIKTANGGQ
ncbi:MAG: hypothetical protein PHE83_18440 [Opitutaceae bacterium]|nr:hypothetical protein [Opitutaceae bacterium]